MHPDHFGVPLPPCFVPTMPSDLSEYLPIDNDRCGDKLLFTPGPLTTSLSVKKAMLHDAGSRDKSFLAITQDVRNGVLAAANLSSDEYTCVLMQGSGSFGVEAMLTSVIPPNGAILTIVNGSYGKRMTAMCKVHKIAVTELECPDNETPSLSAIEDILKQQGDTITHVAVCHCETTAGVLNPVDDIGKLCQKYGKTFLVDSMSAFGAFPIDIKGSGVAFMVSSANKCIEGVPGFCFCVASKARLMETKGWARSLVLDLVAQEEGILANGQFRYTPPTQALCAFRQALHEWREEGGMEARMARYKANHAAIVAGFEARNFQCYVAPAVQAWSITTFLYPTHPAWNFETFYNKLSDKGFVLYPGKATTHPCFRVGHIGRLFVADMEALLLAVDDVLAEMQVVL